ncbi:MAG: hypothetical protein JWR61_5472 [Ferruginibacter sp.]|nr:hypothetical protein [Ferruginibacter sp.]
MGFTDFILFPFYVLIFHLIFSARRKRMTDPFLKKYQRQGFWIRVFSAVAFTVFFVYLTPGDSTSLYYPEGYHMYSLILNNPVKYIHLLFTAGANYDENLLMVPDNINSFKIESNFLIARLVAFFCFFTFGKYLLINLCFSMIAYSGVWRLYKFFYEHYPHLHKGLAITIIYLPSLVFWCSGVLKDPVCICMLGWLTYSLYCIFEKRRVSFKNIFIAVIAAYTLYIVKVYIIICYLPFFILYLVLVNLKLLKNTILKWSIGVLILSAVVVGIFVLADTLKDQLGFFALDKIVESVKTQQTNFINMAEGAESSFSLGVEYDGSPGSLLKMTPAAIVATFFRPFLWESKKISTLMSSAESLALILLTIYVLIKAGPYRFIKTLFTDPMISFCFFYSVVFAIFVGATTLNFGTLVRYKIPCLPFYIIALLLILDALPSKKKEIKNSLEM